MTIRMIVACNSQGIIGKDGQIPWHYKEDLRYFKNVTTGAVVIMGRKTWESLPPKVRPLLDRTNIVITSKPAHEIGMEFIDSRSMTATSLKHAICLAREFAPDEDIWLIGGEQVYREGMAIAEECYVTNVPDSVTDTLNVVRMPEWGPTWYLHATNSHPFTANLTLSVWRSKSPMDLLKEAALAWRKWVLEEGGCLDHSDDPKPGWCPKCLREERVTDALFDATEFLDDEP